MKKLILNTLYWALTLLICMIDAPLYGMRSSRVADRYATTQPIHRSCCACFAQLHEAWKRRAHSHCPHAICPQLITAIETADLSTISAHVTPENVNLTTDMVDPHNRSELISLNLLELIIQQQHPICFITACISLLFERGFTGSLLDPIIQSSDRELLNAVLALPEAHSQSTCFPTLPLDMYNLWNAGRIDPRIAQIIVQHYTESELISLVLREQFDIVNRILKHGSLRIAIGQHDVKLISQIQQSLPEILTDRLRYERHSVTVEEYEALNGWTTIPGTVDQPHS